MTDEDRQGAETDGKGPIIPFVDRQVLALERRLEVFTLTCSHPPNTAFKKFVLREIAQLQIEALRSGARRANETP